MSRATELAIAEAERVEAELGTEPEAEPETSVEAEPEPEPEPEPDDTVSITPEAIGKAQKAIDAQRKRLAGILGSASVAEDCPMCAGMGFLPALPPEGTTFEYQLGDAGPELLGREPLSLSGFKEAPDKMMCPECEGLGQTITGSQVPHARLAGCSKCQGNGWVTVPRDLAQVSAYGLPQPFAGGNASQPGAEGMPDSWGRPPGHKHWGVPPAQISG